MMITITSYCLDLAAFLVPIGNARRVLPQTRTHPILGASSNTGLRIIAGAQDMRISREGHVDRPLARLKHNRRNTRDQSNVLASLDAEGARFGKHTPGPAL